jgi:hypothetical protein
MRMSPITVAETAVFMRQAADVWTDEERLAFVDFIARNPEAGDLSRRRAVFARCGGAGKAAASAAVRE